MTPVLRCKCKCAICLFKCPAGPTTGSHLHLCSLWSGQTIHFPPPDVPICSSRGFSSYFYGYRQDKCPDCLLTVLWPELVFSHLQRHLGFFFFFCWEIFKCAILGFQAFCCCCCSSTGREKRKTSTAVSGVWFVASPALPTVRYWGVTIEMPTVASGPASQLHNTAYPEQRYVLSNGPTADRPHNCLYWCHW